MPRKKTELPLAMTVEVEVDDDISDDVVVCDVADEFAVHKYIITGCAVIPIVDGKVSVLPKTQKLLDESGYLK